MHVENKILSNPLLAFLQWYKIQYCITVGETEPQVSRHVALLPMDCELRSGKDEKLVSILACTETQLNTFQV